MADLKTDTLHTFGIFRRRGENLFPCEVIRASSREIALQTLLDVSDLVFSEVYRDEEGYFLRDIYDNEYQLFKLPDWRA